MAIVILNWNGQQHLETYLPSVCRHSEGHDIYVIDNDSNDASIPFLKKEYPQIGIIENVENGGFAKGYNDGLKIIENKYTYYVLLNSDVNVTPNWTRALLHKIESDTSIAAVQPKILADKQRECFEHAGAAGGFIDRNGYPFCRGRIFDKIEEDKGQYDNELAVFWTSGACMLIRASVFHELGGFDEDYFAHMEEIDLCWRMQLRGYKIYYSNKSIVYHLGGGTLSYQNPIKVYLNFRNSLFTIFKNHQGLLFTKISLRFILDFIALVMFLVKGEISSAKGVSKALRHFLKEIPNLRKKRKKIKESISNSSPQGIYKRSIVWNFFLLGRKTYSQLNDKFIS